MPPATPVRRSRSPVAAHAAKSRPAAAAETPADPTRRRILDVARRSFFAHGFARCTMDELGTELRMSKKTLYAHFPTKEALVEAILEAKTDEMRRGVWAVANLPDVTFSVRVHRLLAHCVEQLSEISPVFVRDLERQIPVLYARVEAIRREIIPKVWGQVLAEGVRAGHVRRELEAPFIAELVLLAVQGLMHPAALDRHELPPREVIDRVLTIIFAGILTPAGRKVYENGPTR